MAALNYFSYRLKAIYFYIQCYIKEVQYDWFNDEFNTENIISSLIRLTLNIFLMFLAHLNDIDLYVLRLITCFEHDITRSNVILLLNDMKRV